MFQLMNLENWERREHFHHYLTAVPCAYSMTVELDVTALRNRVHERRIPFYAAMIYGIAHVVNRHREFRMALDSNGNLGDYDILHPSYTIFHPDSETFSSLWTLYQEDFELFYAGYLEAEREFGNDKRFEPKGSREDAFCISCIPWISFTSFQLHLPKGSGYLFPIFTYGKFTQRAERFTLPFTLQAHHAVCDGFHAARFLNELQEWVNSF